MEQNNGLKIDSNAAITPGDRCIITDPEGDVYQEECERTAIEDLREVFYGKNGTRCLLIDVQKISRGDKVLKPLAAQISDGWKMSLLAHREDQNSWPNFQP